MAIVTEDMLPRSTNPMIIIISVKTPLELAKISIYRKIVLMRLGELIRSKNVSFNTGFANQVA
jgi:hypothetical protein